MVWVNRDTVWVRMGVVCKVKMMVLALATPFAVYCMACGVVNKMMEWVIQIIPFPMMGVIRSPLVC